MATRSRLGPQDSWIGRLAGRCLPYRRNLLVAILAACAGAAANALVPVVTMVIVDDVVVRPVRRASLWTGLLLATAAAGYVASFLRRQYSGRLAADVQHDLRVDLLRSLSRLDGTRQEQANSGQLLGRASGDLNMVFGLLSTVPSAIASAGTLLFCLALMAFLSPLLTLVALTLIPALWFIGRRSRTWLYPAAWDAQNRAAAVAGVVVSSTAGIHVVKGFGQETQELRKLTTAARRLFAGRLRAVRLSARYGPALQAVPALGQVGILAVGGWMAVRGQITLGTFLAFSAYLGRLVGPVKTLAATLTMGQQAGAGVTRVLEVIDTRPTLAEGTGRLTGRHPLDVEFDRVGFAYDAGRPVLTDVSLRVAAGETLAVVGSPGSGKSTLTLLLSRFYDVSQGAIRVGGTDIRELTFDSLRAVVSTVPEDTVLISGTVGDNVAYGRPDATEAQIQAATRTAQAHRFVSALPDGYDTRIGDGAGALSGGQRQRLALARAILAAPRILVLDDCTSAVDAQVERDIHDALRTHAGGRTTLIIARRRSTLALADRVAVLDRGRIVDVGTHEELRARCARYRALLQEDLADDTAAPTAADPAPDRERALPPRPSPVPKSAPSTGMQALVAALPPARDLPDIDETTAAQDSAGAGGTAFGLRHLVHGFRFPLLLGLALVVADASAGLSLPYVLRHGMEAGTRQPDLGTVVVASLAALVLVVAQYALQWGAVMVTGRTGERLLYALRIRVFAHLHRLGLDHFENEPTGRTMTRMTTDVDSLSSFLQTGLISLLVSVLTLTGVLAALCLVNASLMLAVAAVLPVLVLATAVFRSKSARSYAEARERLAVVNSTLLEGAVTMRTTQAFRREAALLDRFADRSDAYRRIRVRGQFLAAVYFPFVEFVAACATAVVLHVGADRIGDGTMTVGALVACLLYLDLFFVPVQQLSQLFDGYQQARVSLLRIRDLLHTPSSTPLAVRPLPAGPLRSGITFDDVHFTYRGGGTALAGVRLRIPKGQTVAFVGETGSGKSTLVKLVARFHDPTHGAVLVDGTDLRCLDLASFRRRLGVVPQDPYLFAGTVRESIAYGKTDATEAEVVEAARRVGAHETIAALDGGYGHRVAEGGRNLSVGQRQLISLARAELVQPDILLLDEATASLDLATEALVDRATRQLSAGRTTLVVAHRLSLASRADRIIVVDRGEVLEDGTHDELLALAGKYAGLWHASQGRPSAATAPGSPSLSYERSTP